MAKEKNKIFITDDLESLLKILPPTIESELRNINRGDNLLEVVLDLGRVPEARFVDSEVVLSSEEIQKSDLEYVVSNLSAFDDDNRAGIERTLHRIAAIRNRYGDIIGLTCRVGRAVYGTIEIVRDVIESGQSILFLGRPGVGKTTMLREAARVLAKKKRVVVVDTSNEIGGGGDIPHPAIGRARRMQVPTPTLQHEVMIEAVENHMPEVVVIDEIGRELEAAAARTIAERGVQLVATAHGTTLSNLLMNPTLSDLVGGIESVTLSDEEARRRGTQKSILERKAPPTFDVLVELQDWKTVAIHHDVAAAVDAILRNRDLPAEIRYRDEDGEIHVEKMVKTPTTVELPYAESEAAVVARPVRVFPYGVGLDNVTTASENLHVPVVIVKKVKDADVVMTVKNMYRRRSQPLVTAEKLGIPLHVLRSNTITQTEKCLAGIFNLDMGDSAMLSRAMEETRVAIRQVLSGSRRVELSPQSSKIRRQQHEMAREASLASYSRGKEPRRRVTIARK